MPEEQKPGEMPAAAETVAEEPDDDQDESEKLPEGVKLTLKKLRDEAKAAKTQAREALGRESAARQKLQEKADAELSEVEKLRKKIGELEAETARKEQANQALRDETAIYTAAIEQHAVNPRVVIRLIDREAIERDADGKPMNAGQLVKELLKENPYLKGDGLTQGPPGTPRSNAGAPSHEDRVKTAQDKLAQTGQYPRF